MAIKTTLQRFFDQIPARWLIIGTGGYHLFMAGMMIGVAFFQQKVMALATADKPSEDFMQLMTEMHELIFFTMPYLALTGVLVVLFGILIKPLAPYKQTIHLGLFALFVLWFSFYSYHGIEYLNHMQTNLPFPEHLPGPQQSWPFFFLGLLLGFVQMSFPHLFIFLKFKFSKGS